MKYTIQDNCIVLIFVLILVSALAYLRFTVTNVYSWRLLYFGAIFGIIALGCIYWLCRPQFVSDSLPLLLGTIMVFELGVSYFRSLFVVPMILVDVIPWPFVLFVYYDYFKKRPLPVSFARLSAMGLLAVCLCAIPNIRARYTGNGNAAVFAAYYCISFLPMVFLACKQRTGIFFSTLVSALMLLSLKRSAFLCVVIGLFLYYLTTIYMNGQSRKTMARLTIFFFAVTAAVFLGSYIIQRMNLDILQRLSNIMEDGGSGRDRIWEEVLEYFRASEISEKWFGHGFHAVFYEIQPFHIARYAHNSFLETLYDYGYVGLSLVVLVVLRLVIDTVKMVQRKHPLAPVMVYSLIPTFILGFVSYFFEQSIIILPFCVVWGICLGNFARTASLPPPKRRTQSWNQDFASIPRDSFPESRLPSDRRGFKPVGSEE